MAVKITHCLLNKASMMKIFIQPVINDTKICISIRQGYSMRNSEAAVVHVS